VPESMSVCLKLSPLVFIRFPEGRLLLEMLLCKKVFPLSYRPTTATMAPAQFQDLVLRTFNRLVVCYPVIGQVLSNLLHLSCLKAAALVGLLLRSNLRARFPILTS
jgi:hypothetical protein